MRVIVTKRRIDELAQALADGTTTSRALIEDSLAKIADPDGEGQRTFIKICADQARAMADVHDDPALPGGTCRVA